LESNAIPVCANQGTGMKPTGSLKGLCYGTENGRFPAGKMREFLAGKRE
jgi:hypothetical protein